jgi:hypothetical protein
MSLEEKKTESKFSSFKDAIMYFQTSIRNVALTTTVSFAALGYSRYYRGKSQLYAVGMVGVSILILISSILLNLFLYNDLQELVKIDEYKDFEKHMNINKIFIVVHAIIMFFGLYTFYRLFTKKQFK